MPERELVPVAKTQVKFARLEVPAFALRPTHFTVRTGYDAALAKCRLHCGQAREDGDYQR
jgi:hypothetical protein